MFPANVFRQENVTVVHDCNAKFEEKNGHAFSYISGHRKSHHSLHMLSNSQYVTLTQRDSCIVYKYCIKSDKNQLKLFKICDSQYVTQK